MYDHLQLDLTNKSSCKHNLVLCYMVTILLKSKFYYKTEKNVISHKEGQHFGLCDQSNFVLFDTFLSLSLRLVGVCRGLEMTVAIMSSNIGEEFIVSKLS